MSLPPKHLKTKLGPQLYLKCERCQEFFEHKGHKRRRWCGQGCKQKAWREKNMFNQDVVLELGITDGNNE